MLLQKQSGNVLWIFYVLYFWFAIWESLDHELLALSRFFVQLSSVKLCSILLQKDWVAGDIV